MAETFYTGVKVIQTSKENIDTIFREGQLDTDYLDGRLKLRDNQNQFVVLNDKTYDTEGNETFSGSASVITRVQGNYVKRVYLDKDNVISGIKPRNKEQIMAFDALLDPAVEVVSLTGTAGTGKTLITLASALHLVENGSYDRIILTRPMTQVGKYDLGILPGEINDKFSPYLKNYMCNFEQLLGKRKQNIDDLIKYYNMEFVPFQVIRGASWPNTIVIADEVQTLDSHEMLTLGTRIGEDSKLIIMGDLNQRDDKIAKEKTGLSLFINNDRVRKNPLAASIHLIKCERGKVPALFAEVFET